LLRRDLSERAHHLARMGNLLHDVSPGSIPAVIFGRDEQGRHGNFDPNAYTQICANPAWLLRLSKVHTASRRSRARKDWQWMELDSANSSDALLMNIFCHPGVYDGNSLAPPIASLLNVDTIAQPCFGITPGVPLKRSRQGRSKLPSELTDRTEIDLQLGDLFLEAKLTEGSFQSAPLRLIERYRDLETVFDVDRLPHKQNPGTGASPIDGYQLIRNVLAAFATGSVFCVLCDARRHDLIETWYRVLSAVHSPSFAWRLKLLTWQELAAAVPDDLRQFLDAKYGICAA
jgi:hypothetical protein